MFDSRTLQGAYFALSAYMFWGVVPIYFKFLNHVSAPEILIHRVLWSIFLLLAILAYTGNLDKLRVKPKVLASLALTSALLATNWLIFIYAVLDNNIVETSLGYFINPLVSVFLGMIFLSERLRPLQWVAIGIVGIGIGFQLFYFGAIPWLALALAFSFGFYGLIRKNLSLHSVAGLAVETIIASPVALIGLWWLYDSGEMKFGAVDMNTNLLLVMGGLVTSFPLLCFAAAVTRLSLTVIGMFQYLAPSISLIIAVTIYHEPFGLDRLVTFACIWCALIIFTTEATLHHRRVYRKR